ncbi:MAG: substrate-binding domain-containing protein [Solirubrobacterales bacterium]|nr:substrate-binding domain-containing protein [Solirubrobacterales bacterium]MBV9167955.1 substrate-binding domain-containing protein [Solirubrobacterales bacterium]MBV9534283.1 substrate-binding domain-containing protein [Solirubrobacterales bacterium]
MTPRRVKHPFSRALTTLVALAGTAVLAAGCGSSSSSTSTGSHASGSSSAGVGHAQAIVASLGRTTTSFPAPGPPVTNAKSLAGKTVWYIPISLSVPVFAIANNSLHTALAKVGIHEHACSGESNPSATAACINQAVARGAGAIITDAVPVVLAANAFASAESHHIPVLIVNQLPPSGHIPGAVKGVGNDKLGYALLQDSALVNAEADWVIADSNGKGNVLVMPFTDSPSTLAYAASAVATLHKLCPGCKVTTQKVGLANAGLIPSQTSSALLRNQGVKYVMPEFDAVLQAVGQGLQQAGFGQRVKVATGGGDLPALQEIKAGRLALDVGQDFPYEGWADADEVIRMMLGKPVVRERVPVRLFTAANVGSLRLTPAAQASGEWYGGNAYTTMFEHLWGVG